MPDTDMGLDMTLLNDEGVVDTDDSEQIVEETEATDEVDESDELEETEETEESEQVEPEPEFEAPPSVKAIKEKYPTVFKDFPILKDALFRDRAFTELFPTVEEAREALDDNQAYTNLRKSALSGDSLPLLETLASTSQDSFVRFSRGFLPALFKRDSDVYTQVITPVMENLVRHIHAEGMKYKNEDLQRAAALVSQFLFDDEKVATGEVTKSQPLPKPLDENRDTVMFVQSRQEVSNLITKTLANEIRSSIDPDGVMTGFVKNSAVQTVLDEIAKALEKDSEHMKVMRARWTRASQDGYDDASKRKIITAYLTRARKVIPSIRAKVQSAALGTSKRSANTTERRATPGRKEVLSGKPSTSKGNLPNSRQIDWSRTSDSDIFDGRVTTRK